MINNQLIAIALLLFSFSFLLNAIALLLKNKKIKMVSSKKKKIIKNKMDECWSWSPACNYSWTSHWLIRLSSMWDPKQVTIMNIVFVLKKNIQKEKNNISSK